LITIAFPASRGDRHARNELARGKFHGVMQPTTPKGRYSIRDWRPRSGPTNVPTRRGLSAFGARCAMYASESMGGSRSWARASLRGLPVSVATVSTISSISSYIRWRTSRM
jgi:hypothetical protein